MLHLLRCALRELRQPNGSSGSGGGGGSGQGPCMRNLSRPGLGRMCHEWTLYNDVRLMQVGDGVGGWYVFV